MATCLTLSSTHAVAVLLVLLAPALAAASPAALYGPGRHWIARVTPGLARFDGEATVDLDADFDGHADASIAMHGTIEVVRSGARTTGDHRRTHLDLEIVAMSLAGELPGVGPLTLSAGDGVPDLAADGPLYSAGASDEVPAAPRFAEDTFDILFTVALPGAVLHNTTPLRVHGRIDRLPPIGTRFTFDGPPVALLNDAGATVLQVTAAANTAVRPAPRPCDATGLDAAALATATSETMRRCHCPRDATCTRRTLRVLTRSGLLNSACARDARAQVRSWCLVSAPRQRVAGR